MTVARTAPGRLRLRAAPQGLPDPDLDPPTIAESGDPFAAARIAALVARIERGTPRPGRRRRRSVERDLRRLAVHDRVVVDAILQLQTNWMADYRNTSGIVVADGEYGATVEIEDSTRVDPWIVRQVEAMPPGVPRTAGHIQSPRPRGQRAEP